MDSNRSGRPQLGSGMPQALHSTLREWQKGVQESMMKPNAPLGACRETVIKLGSEALWRRRLSGHVDGHRHRRPVILLASVSIPGNHSSPAGGGGRAGLASITLPWQQRRLHHKDQEAHAHASSVRSRRRVLAGVRGHCDEQEGAANGGVRFVAASVAEPQAGRKSFAKTVIDGMIAGATAGVVVETALYPIDTIKTRLQVARQGGRVVFKGLYSGLAGNLVGVLPASAIFVGVYEPLKRSLLESLPEHLSSVAHFTAGAVGGAAASLVRVPTEVVKQRMQTGQFASASGAVRTILAKEGVRGLYAGFGSFLLRDLPFDAIQFCVYEQLKMGARTVVRRDLNDGEVAAIGAVAGAFTGAITTPLDLIKTRLMTQGAAGRYANVADCVIKVVREEGVATLFRGIGPRVTWIGIGGSIFFGILERTKTLLNNVERE